MTDTSKRKSAKHQEGEREKEKEPYSESALSACDILLCQSAKKKKVNKSAAALPACV